MSYQHSVVFELSDCGVKNLEYYYSDLEDLLAHLDSKGRSQILDRFVEEVRLIGEFSRFTQSKRKDAVRLILKRDEYWIQSEYRLPPVWEGFFSDIITFQQSTPDKIPNYLDQRHKEVQAMALVKPEDELASFNIFLFRAVLKQYFHAGNGSNVFLLDSEDEENLLRLEFSVGISSDEQQAPKQDTTYQKQYLRLTGLEEQIKRWLLTDNSDQLREHKSHILAHFESNLEFQQHCLSNPKIVQRCFEHRFTEALSHVQSIHVTKDFKEEDKEILWALSQVKRLYISNSDFSAIPDQIANLQELSYLQLTACKIGAISPKLGQLKQLEELWLRENEFSSLPDELNSLIRLEKICLDHNPFRVFPVVLFQLPKLTWIRMTDCQIESVELDSRGFDSLEYMSLRRNQIREIPETLLHLPFLKQLDIAGNPLTLPALTAFKKKRDKLNPELRVDVLDTPHFQLI